MSKTVIDPKPGEVWQHWDGGSIYIVGRKLDAVRIQRRPFGDSLAERYSIRLGVFRKIQCGRLQESKS